MYNKCKNILDKLQNQGKIKISSFEFPEPFPLELKLKDILEDKVDEKYYLSDKALGGLVERKEKNEANGVGFGFTPKSKDDLANTLETKRGRSSDTYIIT